MGLTFGHLRIFLPFSLSAPQTIFQIGVKNSRDGRVPRGSLWSRTSTCSRSADGVWSPYHTLSKSAISSRKISDPSAMPHPPAHKSAMHSSLDRCLDGRPTDLSKRTTGRFPSASAVVIADDRIQRLGNRHRQTFDAKCEVVKRGACHRGALRQQKTVTHTAMLSKQRPGSSTVRLFCAMMLVLHLNRLLAAAGRWLVQEA